MYRFHTSPRGHRSQIGISIDSPSNELVFGLVMYGISTLKYLDISSRLTTTQALTAPCHYYVRFPLDVIIAINSCTFVLLLSSFLNTAVLVTGHSPNRQFAYSLDSSPTGFHTVYPLIQLYNVQQELCDLLYCIVLYLVE